MAVTLINTPSVVTPSDNPIVYTFKQPFASVYNISFVVEIFLNGGTIGKFEVFPEVQDSTYVYGKIDVSNMVAPYVPTQLLQPNSSTATIFNAEGYANIYVIVQDKYSTTIDGNSTTHTSVTSDTISVMKAKMPRDKTWSYTEYQKAVNKQFLTDRDYQITFSIVSDYRITVKKDDSYTFSWIDNTVLDTPVNYKVYYTYYNGTTEITNYSETFTTANQGLIGSVYFNLDRHVANGYLTSGQAASCTRISIGLLNTSDVLISPLTFLTFDDTCFFNGATLKFMNKYGAYDSYLFTYNKRYSASVKAFEFERSQGGWNGNTYSQSKTNTGRLSYLKQTTKKLELSSDWLDETTQNWLIQMYESPAVYINEGEENESVIITNSSYQIKQDKHDELFNEIVEIEFTPENSIRI